jgi:hypothetical protein
MLAKSSFIQKDEEDIIENYESNLDQNHTESFLSIVKPKTTAS